MRKTIRQYFAAFRLHDPDGYAAFCNMYKQTAIYAEKNRANVKAWRKKNRDKYNAYQRARYARTK